MTDTCDRALLLMAARQERALSADEQQFVDEHAADCAACAELADDLTDVAPLDATAPTADPALDETVTSSHAVERRDETVALPVVDPETYLWDEDIGRGGMGRIVRARDRRLGRDVAIKELLSERLRGRFEREAFITARLQHPAIVPIYEAGQWPNGEPFYAMKMVAGSSLDAVIKSTPALTDRLAMLPKVIAVADALAYAHSERVIHRDLKPANVLVGAFGETVVIDWGIAKDLASGEPEVPATPYRAADGGLTMAGQALGTPAYMPPEQARGDAVDERADVYALGAMLYHLLGGHAPYRDTELRGVALLSRVESEPPTPLRELEPDVPVDLLAIVDKAMARDPDDRYDSASGFAADLERFQTGKLVSVYDYSTATLVKRWVGRHRAAVGIVAILLVVLAAGGVMSVSRIVSERNRADNERANAQEAALEYRDLLNDMLRESGRREYMAGAPVRAVSLLRDAYMRGDDSFATRMLLGQSMPTLDAYEVEYDAGDDDVHDVVFLPDGTPLAVVIVGAKVELRNALDGTRVSTLEADDLESTDSVSISADGERIVVANNEPQPGIYDVATGARRATLGEPGRDITHAVFSPDGSRVLVGLDGGVAAVHDGRSGALVARIEGRDDGSVVVAAFSADNDRVVTASIPLSIAHVWDANTGEHLAAIGDDGFQVLGVDISPDGSRVVAFGGSEPDARIYDVATGAVVASLSGHEDWIVSARFSHDGARVVTAARDDDAAVWDAATGELISALQGHSADLQGAVFSRDDSFVLTHADDWTARLWDPDTGASFLTLARIPGGRFSAHLSPDGRRVVTTSGASIVDSWHVSRGRMIESKQHVRFDPRAATLRPQASYHLRKATWYAAIDVDPDRGQVLTVPHRGTIIKLWKDATQSVEQELVGHEGMVGPAVFSNDGTRVASADEHGSVRVWDVATGRQLLSLESHESWARSVRFIPDDRLLISTDNNGPIVVWDASSGEKKFVLEGHKRGVEVKRHAIAEDSTRFISTGDDGYARVWDLRTGTLVASLEHGGAVTDARFLTGNRVLTGSDDNLARIWNLDTMEVVTSLEGHSGPVWHVAVDDSEVVVATTSLDGVRLWELATGELVGVFPGQSAELSRDGVRLATTYRSHTVVWDISPETRDWREIQRLALERVPYETRAGRLIPTQTVRVRPAYTIPLGQFFE